MLMVRERRAHPQLRSVVRFFRERRGRCGEAPALAPLDARPDVFLEFYIRERYGIADPGGAFALAPNSVLVGPTLTPGRTLRLAGEVETFTIHLQPTGLARLFGFDMREATDQGIDVVAALDVKALDGAVRRARDFTARVEAAESWLAGRLEQARPAESVDRLARLLARSGGLLTVEDMAQRAGISPRHMRRRFETEVGMTPKRYARLHRFAALVEARRREPTLAWADLAAALGLADQSHLIRETRAFAGRTPAALKLGATR